MNKDEQKKNNGDNDVYWDINGSNDEINIRQNEQKGIFDSNVKLDFSFQGKNKINMKITKERSKSFDFLKKKTKKLKKKKKCSNYLIKYK